MRRIRPLFKAMFLWHCLHARFHAGEVLLVRIEALARSFQAARRRLRSRARSFPNPSLCRRSCGYRAAIRTSSNTRSSAPVVRAAESRARRSSRTDRSCERASPRRLAPSPAPWVGQPTSVRISAQWGHASQTRADPGRERPTQAHGARRGKGGDAKPAAALEEISTGALQIQTEMNEAAQRQATRKDQVLGASRIVATTAHRVYTEAELLPFRFCWSGLS